MGYVSSFRGERVSCWLTIGYCHNTSLPYLQIVRWDDWILLSFLEFLYYRGLLWKWLKPLLPAYLGQPSLRAVSVEGWPARTAANTSFFLQKILVYIHIFTSLYLFIVVSVDNYLSLFICPLHTLFEVQWPSMDDYVRCGDFRAAIFNWNWQAWKIFWMFAGHVSYPE